MKQALKSVSLLFAFACPAPVVRAAPVAFENYATFEAVEVISPRAFRYQSAYAVGPFSWFTPSGASELPGYDSSVTSMLEVRFDRFPVIDSVNMILTVSVDFEQRLEAHDADGTVTGTMTLVGGGEEAFDLNPATINVDPVAGTITRRFGSPFLEGEPVGRATLTEATGIFGQIRAVDQWELFVSAEQIIPIVPGLELIDNLSVTPIATSGDAVTVGLFVPEPSTATLAVVASIILVLARASGYYRSARGWG